MKSAGTLIFVFFLGVLVFGCAAPRDDLPRVDKKSRPVQSLTGDEISRLETGVEVRLLVTVKKRPGSNNCIELFANDDLKYEGDSKHAVSARFASEPSLIDSFERVAIVTGKMTFIKDAADTRETCGIVTGNIFEITEIEYPK